MLLSAPFFTAGWQLGEICSGVNYTTARAQDMLKGKHLLVLDTKWMPYAEPDPSSPVGWRGLDVDLLNQLSWLLGFSYEIQDMGSPADGETWTDLALKVQYEGDLLASYWSPSAERRDGAFMFKGHLDLSTVLIARLEQASGDAALMKRLGSFSRPFTPGLWAAVIALVLLSGCIDWLAERDNMPGHKVTSSLYEYCAGVLWGGFESPLSKTSAIYQVKLRTPCSILHAPCVRDS